MTHDTERVVCRERNLLAVVVCLCLSLLLSVFIAAPAFADEGEVPEGELVTLNEFWSPYYDNNYRISNSDLLGDPKELLQQKIEAEEPASDGSIGTAASYYGYNVAWYSLVNAINRRYLTVNFSVYDGVTVADCKNAMAQIMRHPYYFYIAGYEQIKYWNRDDSGRTDEDYVDSCIITSIRLNYATTSLDDENVMAAAINEALNWTTTSMTDVEKAQAIHDYLVRNVSYDWQSLNLPESQRPGSIYTSYGALVNKKCVCSGYSAAYYQLLTYLGIGCDTISGRANNANHSWNVVQVGGRLYNVDATFDDPLMQVSEGIYEDQGFDFICHDYFLVDDATMRQDHTWDPKYTCSTIYPRENLKVYITKAANRSSLYFSGKIEAIADQVYTGKVITPSLKVTANGVALTVGKDYTVTYENNIEVGTASVLVQGIGDYNGGLEATFHIVDSKISNATVSVADQSYAGAALKPKPTVKIGTTTLTEGTDFTLKYENNINAGQARVVVTGKGKYTGSKTVNFKILPKSLSSISFGSFPSSTYSGYEIKPTVTLNIGGRALISGTDFTLSYAKNVNAGTASMTIFGKGNYNGSKTVNFKINQRDISEAAFSISTQTYTGSAIKPSAKVTFNGKTLIAGTDYTIAYTNNVKVGTATATIKGKGNFTGKKTKTFKIERRAISATSAATIKAQMHTGDAVKPSPKLTYKGKTLVAGTDYTLTYKNNKKLGTATIKITGKGNFKGTKNVTFKIQKAKWVKFASKYKLKKPDGTYAKSGWQKVSGKWYCLDKTGYRMTGWVKSKGKSYYLNKDGVMVTSQWVGNYYLQADGSMATNKWIGKYHVNKKGLWDKTR